MITSCIIVSDNCPFFEHSLESIKGQTDGFIFVITPDWDETGIIDNAINKIKKFLDTEKPQFARIFRKNVFSLHEARQVYIENLPKETDWILQVDSDEVYELKEKDFFRNLSNSNEKNNYMFYPNFINYWKDTKHINTSFGENQCRFFKNISGLNYKEKENGFEKLCNLEGREYNVHYKSSLMDVKLHHFAYAQPDAVIYKKLKRYYKMIYKEKSDVEIMKLVSEHSFFSNDNSGIKEVESII